MADFDRSAFKYDWLFFLGIVFLVFSLALVLFAIFSFPNLILDARYDTPDFLMYILASLQDNYRFSETNSKLIAWLIFFIPGIIFGWISYRISNRLDLRKNSN